MRLRHLTILLICCLSGCSLFANEAERFRSAIDAANHRLLVAGTFFGSTLHPVLRGRTTKMEAVRDAYEHMLREITRVEASMETVGVPESIAARGLWEAHQAFIGSQRNIAKISYGRISDLAGPQNEILPNQATALRGILKEIAFTEKQQTVALQRAYLLFLHDHSLE